jgi:hypothetical protein
MADDASQSAGGGMADAKALGDIATNGALLLQTISELTAQLERMGEIVLPAPHGGTGIPSYAVGDLLYANTTTSLARLADVIAGKVLVSGGVGVAPAWGDVPAGGLSGEVPVVNGGTGLGTLTANNLLVGAGTSDVTFIAPGSNGNFLASNGTVFASSSGATAAQYRANTSTAPAIRPAEIWNAADFVGLTDVSTIPIDLSTGFNFYQVITGNRTLGNPTNTKNGQAGIIGIAASGGSHTLDVGTNWYAATSAGFPVTIASGANCWVAYFVVNSTYILVTGVINNPA